MGSPVAEFFSTSPLSTSGCLWDPSSLPAQCFSPFAAAFTSPSSAPRVDRRGGLFLSLARDSPAAVKTPPSSRFRRFFVVQSHALSPLAPARRSPLQPPPTAPSFRRLKALLCTAAPSLFITALHRTRRRQNAGVVSLSSLFRRSKSALSRGRRSPSPPNQPPPPRRVFTI